MERFFTCFYPNTCYKMCYAFPFTRSSCFHFFYCGRITATAIAAHYSAHSPVLFCFSSWMLCNFLCKHFLLKSDSFIIPLSYIVCIAIALFRYFRNKPPDHGQHYIRPEILSVLCLVFFFVASLMRSILFLFIIILHGK